MKKLITHNGPFHSDDIFAAATLSLYLEKQGEEFEIIRTRDEEIIKNADYVFDVGGIYDEAANRFDHHQQGGAGKRENNIDYASFGLVWKKFGTEMCGSQKSRDIIDTKVASPIDAHDNGILLVDFKKDIYPYTIQRVFEMVMRPTWQEDISLTNDFFFMCVNMAKEILKREIKHAQDRILAEENVLQLYNASVDKRIIFLDKYYPFSDVISSFPEPLFVVSPRREDSLWAIIAVSNPGPKTFINRKDLPEAWAGLRDEELQKVTGVSDAIFCHRGKYLAVAGSKDGAMKLAQIAVNA